MAQSALLARRGAALGAGRVHTARRADRAGRKQAEQTNAGAHAWVEEPDAAQPGPELVRIPRSWESCSSSTSEVRLDA